VRQLKSAGLEDAKRVIAAGEEAALQLGQPMNIAVVDAGGNLIAHERMNGAWLGSIDISIIHRARVRPAHRGAGEQCPAESAVLWHPCE
jgi:uncharacterized protein GlcG (DUF336 family)